LIERPLFVGYIHVSAMTQLVENKEHARNRGPVKPYTMQPEDGRSREGGMRFGHMEIHAVAALGMSRMLENRIVTASDLYLAPVCRFCGSLGEACDEPGREYRFCRVCLTGDHVCMVRIPFSNKSLIQESGALNHMMLLSAVRNDGDPPVKKRRALEPLCELGEVPEPLLGPLREPLTFEHGAESSSITQFAEPSHTEYHRLGISRPRTFRDLLERLPTVQPAPHIQDLGTLMTTKSK
jgi:hypothetical protein